MAFIIYQNVAVFLVAVEIVRQCGVIENMNNYYPQKYHLYGIKDILGEHHSITLDKDGNIYGFGCNGYGQLGLEKNDNDNIIDTATLNPFFESKHIESYQRVIHIQFV